MFPELVSRVKQAFSGFGSAPIQLDLKGTGGFAFDAINAGWYLRNGYPGIYSILSGGMPAWSGESVSYETALNHPTIWACNRVVSESVGFTPCIMKQRKGDNMQVAEGHPMCGGLRDEPNCEITAQEFREMLTMHTVLGGDGFAQIIRRSGTGTAVELHALQPSQVTPDRETTGQKRLVYILRGASGGADKTYTVQRGKPQDILHVRGIGWNGVRGLSVITAGRQSFGTALAAERFVARFYANGGRQPYYLKFDKPFKTDEEFDKFRADWEKIYSEPNRAPMLEPWLSYQSIGSNLSDSQMVEMRKFTVSEICRWFRVSPHLVSDLSQASFNNIEQLGLEFVTMTLAGWYTRWEQALRRCLLTDEEKAQGYYWEHDFKIFLRGDITARFQAYASALQNGYKNVDEVRRLEGDNPLPDGAGSEYHIQLNMQPLPAGSVPQAQPGLVKLGPKQQAAA